MKNLPRTQFHAIKKEHWLARFIPAKYRHDETVVLRCPISYFKTFGPKYDRNNKQQIKRALKSTRPNAISEAMEVEVARILLRLGSLTLPLKSKEPVVRMKPAKDAFERIAIDIAMNRFNQAMNCALWVEPFKKKVR